MSDLIPPKQDVKEQLAWLQWMVHEALGYCWVMGEAQRRVSSDIIAAHLYTNGVKLPEHMKRVAAPKLGQAPKRLSNPLPRCG